jgi:hypothetical protein
VPIIASTVELPISANTKSMLQGQFSETLDLKQAVPKFLDGLGINQDFHDLSIRTQTAIITILHGPM